MRGSFGRWVFRQAPQPLDHGVEQRTQDAWSHCLERGPEFGFGPASFLGDRLRPQEHSAVGQIGPRYDILDTIQDYRPSGVKQHLVLVGVKLAHGKAAAGSKTTQRVGNPRR
jgi:hypothetical protein